MANWCSNTVAFEGSPEALKQIQQLFKTMAEKEKEQEMGQLPDFTTLYNGYFFDIYWNEGDTGVFQYQTKWSPNLEILEQIAQHFKVSFVLDYEEMGNLVYGRATYTDDVLTDIYLEGEDFKTYHFEGEIYESDYEILETLLKRRLSFQ